MSVESCCVFDAMVTGTRDDLHASLTAAAAVAPASLSPNRFTLNSPATPLSTHRLSTDASLRMRGGASSWTPILLAERAYKHSRTPRDGRRKRYHPVIQRHRNDFSHDVYMLKRRHRNIVTSMSELQKQLKQKPHRTPMPRLESPAKNQRQAMLLTEFNPSARHELDADLLASKLAGLGSTKPRRTPAAGAVVDEFTSSKREQSLTMLPPMTKDGSFLINQFCN